MADTNRTIKPQQVRVQPHDIAEVGSDPVAWLKKQAKPGMVLLAHADDGVIWGKGAMEDIELAPDDLFDAHFERTVLRPITLQMARPITLQMARLFNADQEIFLWRVDEGAWRARTITDGDGEERQILDETQVLWGTRVEDNSNAFCRVADGVEGLRHTPPLDLEPQEWGERERRLRLLVRHYMKEDETGWLQIEISRLVEINVEEKK